jgi:hypothetical protein
MVLGPTMATLAESASCPVAIIRPDDASQENEDILFIGGELRGVETLRAGSRSALPHGHAGRKASEPTAPQLYP